MRAVKIIAHLGLSCLWPENSLIAFEKAVELKADGVECDVHQTLDGQLVVIHDGSVDRTTTGKGFIFAQTFDQLRQYRIRDSQNKDRIWEDQRIPTLDEFFDILAPSNLEMRIEIKEVGFEEKVVERLEQRKLIDRSTIISFLPMSICTIKKHHRSVRTSLLTARFAQVRYEQILPCIDAVDFHFGPELNRTQYDCARRDGLSLDFWTIDTIEEFRRACEWEPDYVTTNFPHRLMEELDRPLPDWLKDE